MKKTNEKPLLQLAIQNRDTKTAIKLIEEGAVDVNEVGPYQRTALHYATAGGMIDIIKLLVNRGVAIDIKDCAEMTPLFNIMFSIHNNTFKDITEIIDLLLSKGADINSINEAGYTMLHSAVMENNAQLVKLLMDKSANPNIQDKSGKPAIYHADKYQNQEIIRLLSGVSDKKIKDVETKFNEELQIFFAQDLEEQKKYVNQVDKIGESNLHKAVFLGNLELIQKLLTLGADVNIQNTAKITPLILTCLTNKPEALKLLLNNNADATMIDDQGMNALHLCAIKNKWECAKILLEKNVNIDINILAYPYGCSALYLAIFGNSIDVAIALIKHGADTKIIIPNGFNAFELALQVKSLKLAKAVYTKDNDEFSEEGFAKEASSAIQYTTKANMQQYIDALSNVEISDADSTEVEASGDNSSEMSDS